MSVGNNIKVFRQQNKLYQKELADKVGVTSQVISNWERGYTKPNDEDLISLADALDCSVDALLGRQPKEHIESFDDLDVLMFSDEEEFNNLPEEEREEIRKQVNDFYKYILNQKEK